MTCPPITLGVDVGRTGALAILDDAGDLVAVVDMPDATCSALGAHVRDILVEYRPTVAWVELTQAFPGQGRTSAHNYGRDAGTILGALGAWDVPVHLVSPAVWKVTAGLRSVKGETKAQAKARARQRAVELWPAHSSSFGRVKDHGRAEAALIARHGWLTGVNGGAAT